jgi:hypothetical protein
VEQALAHALDGEEAEPLVEASGLGLGIGENADAASERPTASDPG